MDSLLSHLNVDPYLGGKNRLVLVNIMNKQDLQHKPKEIISEVDASLGNLCLIALMNKASYFPADRLCLYYSLLCINHLASFSFALTKCHFCFTSVQSLLNTLPLVGVGLIVPENGVGHSWGLVSGAGPSNCPPPLHKS